MAKHYFIKLLISALFLSVCNIDVLSAQPSGITNSIINTKQIIDTLCSEYMSGRGYTNMGHIKAADYIESVWKSQGLKPYFEVADQRKGDQPLYGSVYQQKFHINVNTFPEKFDLKINDKKMMAGKDFIIDPSSTGFKGKRKIALLDINNFGSDNGIKKLTDKARSKKAVLFKNTNKKDFQLNIKAFSESEDCKIIIEAVKKKLTWHISNYENDYLHIILDENSLPSDPRKVKINIDNQYLKNVKTQNVAAYVKGTLYPDSFFVFTGHYDHLGNMGQDRFIEGANDNASGIAMLLKLSEHFSQNPHECSVLFIAFGAEEVGILGSKYFVEQNSIDLNKIRFLINLDIVGGGSEGIQIVNSKIFNEAFNTIDHINNENNYLPEIKLRGKAKNSDHWYFFENDVKCFFIYTLGGPPHYHDINDKSETLPLTGFAGLKNLLIDFAYLYK